MIRRVIVAALEIVEARLGIVVIAAVAQGVTVQEVGGVGGGSAVGGDRCDIAPCIVLIVPHPIDVVEPCCLVQLCGENALHVALRVDRIVILRIAAAAVLGIPQAKGSALLIVEEVHDDFGVFIRIAFTHDLAV